MRGARVWLVDWTVRERGMWWRAGDEETRTLSLKNTKPTRSAFFAFDFCGCLLSFSPPRLAISISRERRELLSWLIVYQHPHTHIIYIESTS